VSDRYYQSETLLERALRTIPLGTQTFSKSKTQYPYGVSPFYIQRGQGCRVWDVDGNEYIDFVNALAAVTLGYNDPDVTAAVQQQLTEGVIFSLPHPIEIQVAEKLVEMVPGAEQVRFGKNGSDATTAAVRLARAYTQRDHVAFCGYHGWHDWYIGATARNLGVPAATQALTHTFTYNNLDSVHQLFQDNPDQIAAVILEPMNLIEPEPDFLPGVQAIARQHGALLIFDETVTGFRYARGGAQEHFGVIPDLSTFGKGLANGYPLSAIVGRADVMQLLAEIFFSFTFGGETLSLAAALATLTKLEQESVLETINQRGTYLKAQLEKLIQTHGVDHLMSVSGHPSWSFLVLKAVEPYSIWQIKTLFLQEMFARGILTLGSHNLSYAHTEADLDQLLQVYDQVFPLLRKAVDQAALEDYLHCQPLEPLFKVR